jgi:hypothetical protein
MISTPLLLSASCFTTSRSTLETKLSTAEQCTIVAIPSTHNPIGYTRQEVIDNHHHDHLSYNKIGVSLATNKDSE